MRPETPTSPGQSTPDALSDVGSTTQTEPCKKRLEWNVERFCVGKGKSQKVILRNIAGKTESGQFTAFLGPSGSGKTTLLSCLSLRTRTFEGAMTLNDKPPTPSFFTATALVHQKEVIFGFMTTREHLTFQAIARMGGTHTKKQIAERVEEVIREARLEKCADTLVGSTSPMFIKRGLSGGERKRVAIASELLYCPDIFLLDEPTTGLDSVTSAVIIDLLRDLATRGRIVLASLHCPSSDQMRLFTHILLLTHNGRLAFHGPADQVVPHFQRLGYEYPIDFNPADYLLEVVSPQIDASAIDEDQRMRDIEVAFAVTSWFSGGSKALVANEAHKSLSAVRKLGSSDWTLFRINAWRSWVLLKRDTVNLGLWTFISIMLGFVFGLLFFMQAPTHWRNIMGLTYALAVNVIIVDTIADTVKFPMEYEPIKREILSGSNAIGPYLAARQSVLLVPMMYGPFLMTTIIYFMTGMQRDFFAYLIFTGIVMACACGSSSLGMLSSCFSDNISVGIALVPCLVVPMILFSGLLYQRSSVPFYLSWMESISIINYTFSALLIQQHDIVHDGSGFQVLEFLEINPSRFNFDVIMILVLILAINLLIYATLHIRLRLTNETYM